MSVNRIVVSLACLLGITVASVQAADQPKPAPTVKAADSKAPAKPAASDAKTDTKADAKAGTKPEPKSLTPDPMDWPNWRGPEQNGISREKDLVDHWSPPKQDDKGKTCSGRTTSWAASPRRSCMRGKLYTIVRADPSTQHEGEKVVCVDAATGKKLWENRFNVYLSDVPAERVGWSSCVGDPHDRPHLSPWASAATSSASTARPARRSGRSR